MKPLQAAIVALFQLVVTGPVIVFFPSAVFIHLPMLPVNLLSGDHDPMA